MKVINIARQFSDFPVGHHYEDGPDSGERFRDEFLETPLRNKEPVRIELSGVEGYGSLFLSEAFGGIVRKLGLTQSEANKLLTFSADPQDQTFVDEIRGYIADACAATSGSK